MERNDYDYYLRQIRRTSASREKNAEKEIRALYKSLAKDLQDFVADEYVKNALEDGTLTYAALASKGTSARFLAEVEQLVRDGTIKPSQVTQGLVEQVYDMSYTGLTNAVVKNSGIDELAKDLGEMGATPEQIKRAVENPISGLTLSDTLEKNRANIIYDIKRSIGVGLSQGDRYTTMAKRIATSIDGDYQKAIRIARTETHRIREAGTHDAANDVNEALKAGTSGKQMVKTWKSMQDGRVRDTHAPMNGKMALMNDKFELPSGATAYEPGGSGVASEDINCRCYLSYRLMTDEEYFKATGKHFEGYDKNGFNREEARKTLEPAMQGLTNEQKEQLLDKVEKGRPVERDLLMRNMDKFGYDTVTASNDNAWYSPRTGKITIHLANEVHNQRGAYATLFHESGHWADNMFGSGQGYVSNAGGFYKRLKKDGDTWVEDFKQNAIIKRLAENGYTDAEITDALKKGATIRQEILAADVYKELYGAQHSGVSDILRGITRNTTKVSGNYGHSKDYYNNASIEHEAFAHFFEANITGGYRRDKIYAMFPEAGKWYDEAIETLAGRF